VVAESGRRFFCLLKFTQSFSIPKSISPDLTNIRAVLRRFSLVYCLGVGLAIGVSASHAEEARTSDCSNIKRSSADAVLRYKLCQASFLEPLDPARREWYGERYSPQKFVECVKREPLNSDCDVYRLKRVEQPEYWPEPGKVPPIKWPRAETKDPYRKGM